VLCASSLAGLITGAVGKRVNAGYSGNGWAASGVKNNRKFSQKVFISNRQKNGG